MESISFKEFQKFLKENKFDLKATQNKLCFPIIERLYEKMVLGVEFDPIKVADESIINGHHRYISSILAHFKLERVIWTAPKSVTHFSWEQIEIDASDWESETDIKAHNEKDAQRAGMNIERFNILLKTKKDS